MGPIFTVFRKEILDNIRDRRALVSSVLLGALMGPIVFSVMMPVLIGQILDEADEALELAVIGAERAPNLIQFLSEQGVETLSLDTSPEAAVRDRDHDVVLEIPEDFPADFRAGRPATVLLIVDRSNSKTSVQISRTRAVLRSYGQRLAALRLQIRGVDPLATVPIAVEEVDVSTPAGRSALLLGSVPLFMLISVLMGGISVAIDSTAGERERKSLEPLLTLPVGRGQLVLGKIAATCVFGLFSLSLTIGGFGLGAGLLPLEELDMVANFGASVMLVALLVVAPIVPMCAAVLVTIASFTRSFKEAQTYISLMMFAPLLPGVAVMLFPFEASVPIMTVPFLSQVMLVTELIKGEPIPASWVLASVLGALSASLALTWLAVQLYRREALLG